VNRTLLVTLFMALVATACSSKPADPTAAYAAAPSVGGAAAAKTAWVRYDDPSERAFSIEVPQGWKVQGGMYRFGYFDVRVTVDMRSPDGNMILRLDDANIPAYALPGPNKPAEGQPYSKPQQFQMMVEKYRTAQDFAQPYGKSRFKSACQTLTPQTGTWKPSMPAAVLANRPNTTSEVSVDYTCATAAGPRLASVFIRTSLYTASGFWQADPVLSILTAADLMPQAQSVMQHVLDSFQIYPQWQAHQQQMTQEGAALVQRDFQTFLAQTRATMQNFTNSMNQQVSGFEAQQNAQAAQVQSWGNTLTGLTNARDPLTGQQFQVWTGPDANHYQNGLGTTVNSNSSPGAGYHQLQTQPQ
jgi:hypothetical protein